MDLAFSVAWQRELSLLCTRVPIGAWLEAVFLEVVGKLYGVGAHTVQGCASEVSHNVGRSDIDMVPLCCSLVHTHTNTFV